jgi:dynein intermediate chain
MLSQPQEVLQLQHKQGRPVAVTSLAFPAGDVNNFIVGSEEGNVYTACRHGSRAGREISSLSCFGRSDWEA